MRTIIINNNRFIRLLPLLALWYSGVGWTADSHRYVVRVDSGLQRLEVHARFAEPVRSISARDASASRYLSNPRDCDTGDALRTRGRRIIVPKHGVTCIRYSVDLERAASAERRNANLSASNIIVSPAAWFWRPPDEAGTIVRFDMAGSNRVSVPWIPIDGAANSYRVSKAPGSSTAAAVFGQFDYVETSIPGALIRITIANSIANSDDKGDTNELVDWIRSAAGNVALAYGRFPNPSPSVLVLPVGDSRRSDAAVRFGRVIRDGGEAVELFVNRNVPMDEFYDDWTATHEFSHLMLPYVASRHRWISEGFAQYYQNILMARAGQYSELRAWQKIVDGLERGRLSSPRLSPNQAAAGDRRGSTMKVYWSGAAIALLADVELRRRSNGERSLDSVLKQLAECCLPAGDAWSGTRLFETLDSFLDEPLFIPLYRKHADAAGFPDTRQLLQRLGVSVKNGALRLDQGAELAPLRQAIAGH